MSTTYPGSVTYNFQQLETLWKNNGGDPQKAPIAAAFSMAESGGKTGIVSNTNDWGLWQINNGGQPMLDPNANAKTAISMSNNGTDWSLWSTAFNGGDPYANGGTGYNKQNPNYLGPSAPVWQYITGAAATAAGLTSSGGTDATLLSASAPAQAPNGSGAPADHKVFSLFGSIGGPDIKTNDVRAVGGGLLIAAGVGISIIGLSLLLLRTKTAQNAMSAVNQALPTPVNQLRTIAIRRVSQRNEAARIQGRESSRQTHAGQYQATAQRREAARIAGRQQARDEARRARINAARS